MKSIRRKIPSNIRDESNRTVGACSSSAFLVHVSFCNSISFEALNRSVCSFSYLTNPSSRDDVVVITKEE